MVELAKLKFVSIQIKINKKYVNRDLYLIVLLSFDIWTFSISSILPLLRMGSVTRKFYLRIDL